MKIQVRFRNIKLGEWCKINVREVHIVQRINRPNQNPYCPMAESLHKWYPKCINNETLVDRLTNEEKAEML